MNAKCSTYLLVLLEALYEGFCCGWEKLLEILGL